VGEPLARHWSASLDLRFGTRRGQTVLLQNTHCGPLRLIKALKADGETSAAAGGQTRLDAMIVHPPGGLAAGDSLRLRIDLEEGARVRSSTPGSQKWYRGRASASTHIRVARGAQLEWLPQPSIVYDGAFVDQSLRVDLDADCAMVGSECLVLGRRSMGERFANGWLRQSIRINRAGRPVWQEFTDAAADAPLWGASAGWAGRVVCASVWAIGGHGATWDEAALVDQWRATVTTATGQGTGQDGRLLGGATCMAPGIVLAKILGDEADTVSALAQQLWALARPPVLGEAAQAMRIWAT
jgi:urease accessory protein